jgi:hypothetical protein
MRFQRRTWAVERAGHMALVVIVVLALAGLFSGGPFSDAVARDARSGLAVSYERFARLGRSGELTIDLGAPTVGAGVELSLPASYLEQFELRSIAPEPESEIATGDTVTYSFAAGTRQVLLQLEPSSIGLHSGRVTAGGVVEFDQMVWP